jgi:alkylation response protein AidB-like acyl-CoA dehydrogenase
VQLRDTPDEAAYRAEVRTWLGEHNPGLDGLPDTESKKAWSRKIYDAGYAGVTWPKEYGGQGASYSNQAILYEEWARAEAPGHLGVIGLGMAGPTIIAHGTDEQKQRYLANILSAEEIWCQGFSEPGAGSDLAALRTSAELCDGHFVVSGQKVWSSYAHIADWCLLLTRSDPESQKHAGLTYMVVDMHSPGIEVRPLRHITGDADFNEIFFENVEVPVENVLDEIGNGWAVAMTTLLHERGTLGFALTGGLEVLVSKIRGLAKERNVQDSRLRDMIVREWIGLQALKLTNYRALTKLVETGIPGPEGSVSKLVWSEAMQRSTKLALEIQEGEADEWWRHGQLRTRGNTIEAGTSEILRNIIAERVLGLPRSR